MEPIDEAIDPQAIPQRAKRSPEQWRQLVGAQRCSGLGVEEYCRQQHLTSSCFYRWRRFLTGSTGAKSAWSKPAQPSPPQVQGFATVRVAAEQSKPWPAGAWGSGAAGESIRILLAGGRELILPVSMPTRRLVELVLGLEGHGAAGERGA